MAAFTADELAAILRRANAADCSVTCGRSHPDSADRLAKHAFAEIDDDITAYVNDQLWEVSMGEDL